MNQTHAQTVSTGRSFEAARHITFAERNQEEKGWELSYHNNSLKRDEESVGKIEIDTNMEGSRIGQVRTKRGIWEGTDQGQVMIEEQGLNEEVQIIEKPHQTQARKGEERKPGDQGETSKTEKQIRRREPEDREGRI